MFDSEEMFQANITTTHIVMVITDLKGWSIRHINVINAFLHGNLKEKKYMTHSLSMFTHSSSKVCRLK
jgi:hypothetical protein